MSPYRDPPPAGAPSVLVCAGLDPSGGAGLLADVRVLGLHEVRAVGVVTALTVQNTTGVVGCSAMDPEKIREQLELLLQDVEVKAVKIGMIGSSEIAISIGQALALTQAPVVWDPILYPSRGDVRFVDSSFGRALKALAPHLALITPNLPELEFLTGVPGAGPDAAENLAQRLDTAVLVKGGHAAGALATDTLVMPSGRRTALTAHRLPRGEHVHGTGCALSSAIAAQLALGAELEDACRAAKEFVRKRIEAPVAPGRGAAAVV